VRSNEKTISLLVLVLTLVWTIPAIAADTERSQSNSIREPAAANPADGHSSSDQPSLDPLAPFNEKMFWFNRELDSYVTRPIATGFADVVPEAPRRAIDRFFTNVGVIPRFANSLFQLKFEGAGREVSRFAINSTVGVLGLFDPADKWFGLKPSNEDFGLTLGHYGLDSGPYLVLPVLGPSTIRDTAGRVADGFMNPIAYLLPFWQVFAIDSGTMVTHGIDYESLNLQLFSDVDLYSVDLYGAVQDAYLQRRREQLKQ
jgi:phospholipid-binding lipoprotein MlaA